MAGEGDGRKVRKCVEATPGLARNKEDTEWRSVARLSCTSCGPRYSRALTPRPSATSPPPTTTTFVLLILSSHFTAIAIALPGVGFQSNPWDPCGKVWLFNFLPRGPSALAFPLSLFISFRASRSRYSLPRPSRFAVTHATRPSISLREERSFFSSFIHCSLRDNFTSGEGICRA